MPFITFIRFTSPGFNVKSGIALNVSKQLANATNQGVLSSAPPPECQFSSTPLKNAIFLILSYLFRILKLHGKRELRLLIS